jgi:uncharacterized membrane protein YdfJ with MMPL/SSD domain
MPATKNGAGVMRFLFRCVNALRFVIPFIWIGIAVLGGLRIGDFFDDLKDELKPSDSAPSIIVKEGLHQLMPHAADFLDRGFSATAVLVRRVDGKELWSENGVSGDNLGVQFVADLTTSLRGTECSSDIPVISFTFLQAAKIPSQAARLVSPARDATLLIAGGCGGFPEYVRTTYVDPILSKPAYEGVFDVLITSEHAMKDGLGDAAAHDIGKGDMLAVPVAFLLLAWRVGSLPMILLPLLSIVTSILVMIAILQEISSPDHRFAHFAPALFFCTATAIGLDWNLFLLTRYRANVARMIEQRPRRTAVGDVFEGDNEVDADGAIDENGEEIIATYRDAVRSTFVQTGRTVGVSGFTLALAFATLILFDSDLVKNIGIGAVINVLVSLGITVTLVPSLLLIFGGCRLCSCGSWRSMAATALTEHMLANDDGSDGDAKVFINCDEGDDDDSLEMHSNDENQSSVDKDAKRESLSSRALAIELRRGGRWLRLTRSIMHRPRTVIAVIGAVSIALAVCASQFHGTANNRLLQARFSEANKSHRTMYDTGIHLGILAPSVVAVRGSDGDLVSPAAVSLVNSLLADLCAGGAVGVACDNIYGPTWIDGRPLTLAAAKALRANATSSETARVYDVRVVKPQFASPSFSNPSGVVYEIDPSFDPLGRGSDRLVTAGRALASEYTARAAKAEPPLKLQFYFGLGNDVMFDARAEVYDQFAWVASIIFAGVFAIMFLTYNSVVIAVRVVFTSCLTLLWSVGLGVVVFEYCIGVDFFWLSPVFAFPIIIGLSLDYDVFVMDEISELYRRGFRTRVAVLLGVARSGSVITVAGLCMFVAFVSLVFASMYVIVQIGFAICISVLVDAFVIRMCLVPATMELLGDFSWWPGFKWHCAVSSSSPASMAASSQPSAPVPTSSAVKFCTKCGGEATGAKMFCSACGTKL